MFLSYIDYSSHSAGNADAIKLMAELLKIFVAGNKCMENT